MFFVGSHEKVEKLPEIELQLEQPKCFVLAVLLYMLPEGTPLKPIIPCSQQCDRGHRLLSPRLEWTRFSTDRQACSGGGPNIYTRTTLQKGIPAVA